MRFKGYFVCLFCTIFCLNINVWFTIDTIGFYANNLTFICTNRFDVWHHWFLPFWLWSFAICITYCIWILSYISIKSINHLIINPNCRQVGIITNRLNKLNCISFNSLFIRSCYHNGVCFGCFIVCHHHGLTYFW